MRNFLLLLSLFFVHSVFAQKEEQAMAMAQLEFNTTLEEFKYLSIGYETQIKAGLDATKKGYDIKPLIDMPMYLYGAPSVTVRIVGMYLANTDIVKGYVAIVNPNSTSPEYTAFTALYTVPEVNKMVINQLTSMSAPRLRSYLLAFTALSSLKDVQKKYPVIKGAN